MPGIELALIKPIIKILLNDIVLSGDNAVVIALAAHRLPSKQRRLAVFWGAGGAIILRVILTAVMVLLLKVHFVQLAGGLFLVWIAMKLMFSEEEAEQRHIKEGGNLWEAIKTIIFADFIMSLDNMIAVAGASEGNLLLLIFGLLVSIGIIMTCSTLIADLMNRYPILTTIGGGILGWTAGDMIVKDEWVKQWMGVYHHWAHWVVPIAVIVLVIGIPQLWIKYRSARSQTSAPEQGNGEDEQTLSAKSQTAVASSESDG